MLRAPLLSALAIALTVGTACGNVVTEAPPSPDAAHDDDASVSSGDAAASGDARAPDGAKADAGTAPLPNKCPNDPPSGGTACATGLHCAYGECQPDCVCKVGVWECAQDDCVAPPPCGPSLAGCGAIGQQCTASSGAACECVGPTPAIWKCSGGDAG